MKPALPILIVAASAGNTYYTSQETLVNAFKQLSKGEQDSMISILQSIDQCLPQKQELPAVNLADDGVCLPTELEEADENKNNCITVDHLRSFLAESIVVRQDIESIKKQLNVEAASREFTGQINLVLCVSYYLILALILAFR